MLEWEVAGREGDGVRIRLSGELVGEEWTNSLRLFLKEQYVDDGVTRIILDLSDLQQLDEEGLATLTHLRFEAQRRDKKLFVERAAGKVRGKLHVAGLLDKLAEGA